MFLSNPVLHRPQTLHVMGVERVTCLSHSPVPCDNTLRPSLIRILKVVAGLETSSFVATECVPETIAVLFHGVFSGRVGGPELV